MKKPSQVLALCVILLGSSACVVAQPTEVAVETASIQPSTTSTVAPARSCRPTLDDGVSPSYKPDTPERSVVGKGHVLTGIVRSSVDCQPIANAKLEFWPEEAALGHPDSSRATFHTEENGSYSFECNLPEHIHMRISAPGYRTIGVNSYHPEGSAEGVFDIVLVPE
jgi:protocatechuate 3,4-dioxygenase beta subunit